MLDEFIPNFKKGSLDSLNVYTSIALLYVITITLQSLSTFSLSPKTICAVSTIMEKAGTIPEGTSSQSSLINL